VLGVYSREREVANDREPLDELQSEPLFMALRSDDPSLLAAVARARCTVSRFRDLVATRTGPDTFHSVKLRFRDSEQSQRLAEDRYFYSWVSFVTCDGDGFVGRLVQPPREIESLHGGQSITFGVDDLWDWMVNDDGQLCGGFSLRVMRDALPETRREAFDRYVGVTSYEVDDA
jgi:uncharacterized protein YegJ (DUF2314 family)